MFHFGKATPTRATRNIDTWTKTVSKSLGDKNMIAIRDSNVRNTITKSDTHQIIRYADGSYTIVTTKRKITTMTITMRAAEAGGGRVFELDSDDDSDHDSDSDDEGDFKKFFKSKPSAELALSRHFTYK